MEVGSIRKKIDAYKRKYYLNYLVKGLLRSLGYLLTVYLFYIFLEYSLRSGSVIRAFFFYSYLIIVTYLFCLKILLPFVRLVYKPLQMTDEDAAGKIGNHFVSIKDKLLNVIQLSSLRHFDKTLIDASIKQKSLQLGEIKFDEAIRISNNKKYLIYLFAPFLLVALTSLISPGLLTESTERIIYYRKNFPAKSPFKFIILNNNLSSFHNEDYLLQAKINGSYTPDEVFIVMRDKRLRIVAEKDIYSYTFRSPVDDIDFLFEAAGYKSEKYTLKVNNRPNIKNFTVLLNYPKYLSRKSEVFNNIGNFQVPEGTVVRWDFETLFTDNIDFIFSKDSLKSELSKSGNQHFRIEKKLISGDNYEIQLINEHASNKDKIKFHIDVIPDEFPVISLNQYQDTVLYKFLILGGNINDDYGINDLKIFYRTIYGKDNQPFNYLEIPISTSENSQNFYFHWNLDSLNLSQSEQLEYYVQVLDNDGINGPKASKTGIYLFKIPDRDEMKNELSKSSQTAENQLDKNEKQAKQLNDYIDEVNDRLKGKKQLDWQDRKMIEDLIKKKDSLEENIRKLQELTKANTMKNEIYGSQNEKIKEKMEQLQNLLNEMLDEDTKKLFDELNRLLNENKDLEQIKEMIEKIDSKEQNLLNDIERTLELFKRLKYEIKLDETINSVNDLQKKQDSISNLSENKNIPLNELSQKQEILNKDFKKIQKNIENLLDLNQDLKSPFPVENTMDQEKNIQQEQQNASDNLNSGDRKKASKSQQQAAHQLKQLQQKMEKMQSGSEMTFIQENLDDLRNILDNLIKLSFSQENLMIEMKRINISDPRYNELSQAQLNLKDDAKIIEDSLLSLASRVVMISSFVTRKLNEMNQYIDQSTDALKERKKPQATGLQQFAMTSMNDLALLLDDVLTSMQNQMASMMGMPSKSNKNDRKSLELSKIQERLNEQINNLKKSGKSGRSLSEELAKLAAEQERIRNILKEEKLKQLKKESGDGNVDEIIKKMEDSELDLVNKNITQQLINRQKEIMTRLLESEKSMREQELDNKREAERAKSVKNEIPPSLREYLKLKENETELLKTMPPKLNPYYKREVSEYFKRLQSTSY